MEPPHHYDLIRQYVYICNEALLKNKDRFPFKQILGAAQRLENGCVVEVNVLGLPLSESFVFRLREEGIDVQPHADCRDCNCDRTWNVSRDYLKEVARNPQNFIKNPAKINWEWMYPG